MAVWPRKQKLVVFMDESGLWKLVDEENPGEMVPPFTRKREATLQGRALLKKRGGGQLIVRSPSGRIVEQDEIRP
jgi:hypothetical protein